MKNIYLFFLAALVAASPVSAQSITTSGLNMTSALNFGSAYQNVAYNGTASASGGIPPYTYTISVGSLPTGITIGSCTALAIGTPCVFSGTPSGTGASAFTIKVTDSASNPNIQTLATSITVATLTGTGPCGSAICVTPTGQAIQTNATIQLTATGYWSDSTNSNLNVIATWTCATSPACGSVSSSGQYTAGGAAATYTLKAVFNSVTDDGGSGISVVVGTTTPTISTNATLCNGQINQPYPEATTACPIAGIGVQFTASGGAPPYTWSVTVGAFQAGLTLSGAGVLSGQPSAASTLTPTVQVCDTTPTCSTFTPSLTVASLSSVAVTPVSPSIPVNATLQFTLTGTYSDSSTANVTNQVVGGGGVTQAFVNSTGGSDFSGAGHTTQTTGTFNMAAGNLDVVICRHSSNATTCSPPTDVGSANTYTAIDVETCSGSNDPCGRDYYAKNTVAVTNDNVTCNYSASVGFTTCIHVQYSGSDTSAPLDVHSVGSSGSSFTNSCVPASITTTNATDAVITLCFIGTHGRTFTPASGFTLDGADTGTSAQTAGVQRKFVSVTQTIAPTMTFSGAAAQAITFAAAFKAAASSAGWTATDASGGPNVAAINSTGLVTANNSGTSTIQGCIGATCGSITLTVTSAADTSLVVTPATTSTNVNTTQAYTATGNVSGNNLTATSVWASSPTTVATMNANVATCIAAGSVTITAQNGNLTGTATLNCTSATGGAYTSRTDLNAAPEVIPTFCTPAPCKFTTSDLNANTTYVRVTDANTNTTRSGDLFAVNGSDESEEWNSNTTAFYAYDRTAGEDFFYNFTAATETVARITCSYAGSSCVGGSLTTTGTGVKADGSWSGLTPYVFFGTDAATPGHVNKMDFSATVGNAATAPTITQVTNGNISSSCTSIPTTQAGIVLSGSNDDIRFAGVLGPSQDNWSGIYVVDVNNGCRWFSEVTSTGGGSFGPTGNFNYIDQKGTTICSGASCSSVGGVNLQNSKIHNVRISPDGRWARITFSSAAVPNTTSLQRIDFWDISTNNIYIDDNSGSPPQFCGNHIKLGYNNILACAGTDFSTHYFNKTTLPPAGVPGTGAFSGTWLITGTAAQDLNNIPTPRDYHNNWNNQAVNTLPPLIVSAVTGAAGTTFTLPYEDEVIGVSTDGSGTVFRFCHQYTRMNNFYADGFGNSSRDGKWVVFSSDMNNSARTDTFVCPLK